MDSDKYLVICVAKNENPYIEEWIDHYLKMGFDKIIIGDNNDDDSLQELLSDYIKNDTVELYDCKGMTKFQGWFYTKFSTVGDYKWAAYFDCDEFLVVPGYQNIKDYLETVTDDCVCFNWIMMSNDGKLVKEDKPVLERFKTPMLPLNFIKNNYNVKSIIRGGKSFIFTGPHVPVPNEGGITYNYGGSNGNDIFHGMYVEQIDYRVGYIKHYTSRSFEECLEKSKRGYPDGGKINDAESVWRTCLPNTIMPLKDYIHLDINQWCKVIDSYEKDMDECKYIKIVTKCTGSIVGVIQNILALLEKYDDKVFIFERDKIPIDVYSIVLGYSLLTTNKVLTVSDDFEDYVKATNNLEPNFILTFTD